MTRCPVCCIYHKMHATSIHRLSIVYVHVSNVLFIFFSGALIGFADLGEVNTHLSAFERMLKSDRSCTKQPLAKSILVLMVRGLQFPTLVVVSRGIRCSISSGKQLGVSRGMGSVCLTCDGLAANRQLFRLHAPKRSKELVHKALNPYSKENRYLSDPPHLMKTIRNCFANKNRHLWVRACQVVVWMVKLCV